MATLFCGICLVQDTIMVRRHSATVKVQSGADDREKTNDFDDL
jgi:hypothetical protein